MGSCQSCALRPAAGRAALGPVVRPLQGCTPFSERAGGGPRARLLPPTSPRRRERGLLPRLAVRGGRAEQRAGRHSPRTRAPGPAAGARTGAAASRPAGEAGVGARGTGPGLGPRSCRRGRVPPSALPTRDRRAAEGRAGTPRGSVGRGTHVGEKRPAYYWLLKVQEYLLSGFQRGKKEGN